MQKKSLKTLHAIALKQDILEKKLNKTEQRRPSDVQSIRLSNNQLKLIKEYFPIDKNEENEKKKMDAVETKLKADSNFLKIVVSHIS